MSGHVHRGLVARKSTLTEEEEHREATWRAVTTALSGETKEGPRSPSEPLTFPPRRKTLLRSRTTSWPGSWENDMTTWGDTLVRTAGYTQGRTTSGGRPTMAGCPPTTTGTGERGTTASVRTANTTTNRERATPAGPLNLNPNITLIWPMCITLCRFSQQN